MSRVGKRPIEIPDGVEITIDGRTVHAKGPKGELEREIPETVSVELTDGELRVNRPSESRQSRSHQGLTRSLLGSIVEGVAQGFDRKLEIHGVGYRAEQHGNYVRFDLGFSHPVLLELPDQVEIAIEKQTQLTLTSPDKELLGQVAAKIRGLRPPEPYKGKGIRYQGERIVRKVGKAGAA
ncbi:MAG: 50S ribosomal protein L6 [Persicimonas sp.]